MAYIGNTVQNQGFSPAIDYFNGNGVTVTFTLSRPVASVAQMIVAIDNVIQNPSSAFSVVGNSITFTSAPLSGTNNIWVEYTSLITTYQGISQDPTVIGDIRATGGYLAEGDFGNSFVDGNLIDYVTGAGRLTVGELDDLVFYHGGTSARSEMMRLSYADNSYIVGRLGVGTTSPLAAAGLTVSKSADVGRIGIERTSTYTGTDIAGSLLFYYSGDSLASVNAVRDGANDAAALTFGTQPTSGTVTERMRISSAGYVTQPFQPAFSGGLVGASGNVTANPLVFNSALLNQGSCYNTSTGLFTCPVAGVYRVSCSTTTFINGYTAVNITLRKNGSDIDVAYGKGYWEGSLSSSYLGKTASWLISCAASDNLGVGGTVYREPTASYCTLTIELVG
jgi:hypothetical protein